MSTHIRQRYPVTTTDLLLACSNGRVFDLVKTRWPAAYTSPRRKVHRWPAEIIETAKSAQWAITGRTFAKLQIISITKRTDFRRIRAWGTGRQMHLIIEAAAREWHSLPGGREIETLFERMFPATLQLETEEPVDKTKPVIPLPKKADD